MSRDRESGNDLDHRGTDFIGIWTVRALAGRDDIVLGYNRSVRGEEGLRSLIGARADIVRLDVTSPYSVARALAQFRPSGIVRLAVPALGAMRPAEESLANVQSLMNILEPARSHGVGRVSLASSTAVYAGRSYSWTPQQLLGGLDLIHVDDCARAVAAIHLADTTSHRMYNVGGGAAVSADALLAAVEAGVPGRLSLREVHMPPEKPLLYGAAESPSCCTATTGSADQVRTS